MIKIDSLTFSFKRGKPLFTDLNLYVGKGEYTLITGASGSGKTTLLKLLRSELLPNSGNIEVSGISLVKINNKRLVQLRRSIGIVHQDFRLVDDMTVYENVALPLKIRKTPSKRMKARTLQTLGEFDLTPLAAAYPEELSGGEKQRTAIARALIGKPLVLLADEPTGSLDPETSVEIGALLNKINVAGTTVVVVSHDTAVFQNGRCRTLKIIKGRLKPVE
ncbi:MAG: ATP-binding cassette domain-containing protein [candidate division Zixibacteria bacterium]|nr:ATP-binding cassette domain-containing protein [candidate division Zixibacteria bacterium]